MMYKGHFGSPSHFLRQRSCPSHQAIESIMAHYGPSAEMNTLRPRVNVPGGWEAPQPSGLCKGGQFTVTRGTIISTGSLSYHTSFTLCLIRSEVSYYTHKSSPPPFQQSTQASPQMGKCFESLSSEISVSALQRRSPSSPETFEFQSQAHTLSLSVFSLFSMNSTLS